MLNNKLLLDKIQAQGVDATLNEIDSERVEDDLIKIIVRTAQHSKHAFLETLKKSVAEERSEEINKTIT